MKNRHNYCVFYFQQIDEFKARRQKNIDANRAFLASLNIQHAKEMLKAVNKPRWAKILIVFRSDYSSILHDASLMAFTKKIGENYSEYAECLSITCYKGTTRPILVYSVLEIQPC